MNRRAKNLLPFVIIVIGLLALLGAGLWLLNPFASLATGTPTPTTNAADIPNPEIARVHLPDARAAFDLKNAVFVDVRGEPFYSEGHIPGALSIPLADLSNRLGELNKGDWIIPYCTWPNEESSARAARILLDNGFTKVTPILGGFEAWAGAGYPVEKSSGGG